MMRLLKLSKVLAMLTIIVFGYELGGSLAGKTFYFDNLQDMRAKIDDENFTFNMLTFKKGSVERRISSNRYYVNGGHPTLMQLMDAHVKSVYLKGRF